MLIKIIVSFLCGVAFVYLFFCLFLNTPIMTGGDIKAFREDIKHRWFWVMSLYIGKALLWIFIVTVITIIPYAVIFIE
jgi:hypothetical protein